jgi:predicted transcriptional regulator
MTQAKLAKLLEIDQSSVSRALNQAAKRNGKARQRICKLMQERSRGASPVETVEAIWDGSPEHGEALSRLLRASQHLWPGLGKERR